MGEACGRPGRCRGPRVAGSGCSGGAQGRGAGWGGVPSSPARVAGAEGLREGGALVRRARDPEQGRGERGGPTQNRVSALRWASRWRMGARVVAPRHFARSWNGCLLVF